MFVLMFEEVMAARQQVAGSDPTVNLLVDFNVGLASTMVRAPVKPPITQHLIIEPCPKSQYEVEGTTTSTSL